MTKTRVLLLVLLLTTVGANTSTAQTVDFENLDTERETQDLPDLLQRKKTLWSGRTETLYFETGVLADELLTVSATANRLHVNTGQTLRLLNGELQEKIAGRILYLDLNSVRGHNKIALLTVASLVQDTLRSRVFTLRQDADEDLSLNEFYRSNWSLVRPVGDQMFRQQYDPQSLWVDEIQAMTTTQSGYEPAKALNLPERARLSSLTRIDGERWSFVDARGALTLVKNGSVTTKIKGNFASTPDKIQPSRANWQQGTRTEPIRLPPVVLPERNTLAVMYNPNPSGGLMGWLYGSSSPSSIELFSYDDDSLEFSGSIGPLRSRILDVEVPEANPNQLLWLRTSGRDEVSLEMIDFSKIDTPTGN